MPREAVPVALDSEGMRRLLDLQSDAVSSVTERFYATHGSAYQRFGQRGREACRQDLAFHLEFLRPVLEFGLAQPMVDYLCWLNGVLAARMVPTEHLALSLDWLAEYFTEHMEGRNGSVVANALHDARTRYLAAIPLHSTLTPSLVREPWHEAHAFEEALLAGNQSAAVAIAAACLERGASLIDMELHVVQPALYAIGEKWQENKVSVAQEHLATAIAQFVMSACLLQSPPPIPLGKKILLACIEANHHTVGLRMVADAFQLAGWEVQYLGPNVPSAALVHQVSDWRPNLVGLSVSFPQHLSAVRIIMAKLDEQLGSTRPPVMVGGLAINRFDRLASLVGADATASDAHAAVVTALDVVRKPA